MLTPAIPTIIAVLVWAVLYFTGYDTHTNDGILFVLDIAVTFWLLVLRKPGAPTNQAGQ